MKRTYKLIPVSPSNSFGEAHGEALQPFGELMTRQEAAKAIEAVKASSGQIVTMINLGAE